MNLHADIMNISCEVPREEDLAGGRYQRAYKEGHRDARHAAVEIALKADKRIEELESVLQEIVQSMEENPLRGIGTMYIKAKKVLDNSSN